MSVIENRKQLRRIADNLENDVLRPEEKQFLLKAIRQIAAGNDPKEALGLKGKRGERTSAASGAAKTIKRLAMGWIAVARMPENEGGLGIKSIEEACARIGEQGLKAFGLTEATLRKYWNENPDMHDPDMYFD